MSDWAENEVRLAMKRENPDYDGSTFDYGCACYESALKAYKALMEDGHSGFSFSVTRNILNRLMHDLPLTPIAEEDADWREVDIFGDCVKRVWQSGRYPALFKKELDDGAITYNDIQRVLCVDDEKPSTTFSNGFVSLLIDRLRPIALPYMPDSKPIKVYVTKFLAGGEEHGDWDTMNVLYAILPDGECVDIDRYFKEDEDGQMVEIDESEYEERQGQADERMVDEKA